MIVSQTYKKQVELCPLRQPSYTQTSLAEKPQMQTVPEALACCTCLKIRQTMDNFSWIRLDWSNLNVDQDDRLYQAQAGLLGFALLSPCGVLYCGR